MSRTVPRFPRSVAEQLLRPAGDVSFRYTVPARLLAAPPRSATPLLETEYTGGLLVALVLEPSLRLRFIRTGNAEGAREASVGVSAQLGTPHWSVVLTWDADTLSIRVAVAP